MTQVQGFVLLLGVALIFLSVWENWRPEVEALI